LGVVTTGTPDQEPIGRMGVEPVDRLCGRVLSSLSEGCVRFESRIPSAARRLWTPRKIASAKAGLNDPRAERSSSAMGIPSHPKPWSWRVRA